MRYTGRHALIGGFVATLASGVLATAVAAADARAPSLAILASRSSGWQFQATAYGWATALSGESGVRNLPPASIDMSFGDLLENLDGAVMGSFLAKNGNWMILTDLIWAQLSADALVKLPGARHPTLAAVLPCTRVEFEMRQMIASAIACRSPAAMSISMPPRASAISASPARSRRRLG